MVSPRAGGAPNRGSRGDARTIVCDGARAAEAWLFERIREDAEVLRSEPGRCALPLRVVVPSRTLRVHLTARIAEACGSVLGVRVQTLGALVDEILTTEEGAGPADGELLFPLLVRRVAETLAGEGDAGTLRRALAGFEDGYGALGPTVADLLDAGFRAEHFEACAERLALLGTQAAGETLAILRIALGVREAFGRLGFAHRSDRFERAAAILEDGPERLAARAAVLYGFADATGSQARFLLTLLRCESVRAVFDVPENAPPEALRFAEPLQVRFAGIAGTARGAAVPSSTALGIAARNPAEEQAHAVAAVAEEIASGTAPERIGLVARDLEPYRRGLEKALRAAGIPFSGAPGEHTAAGPWRRRIRALQALLALGPRARLETWLAARDASPDAMGWVSLWASNRLVDLPEQCPEPARRSTPEAGRSEATALWRDARRFAADFSGRGFDTRVALAMRALGKERADREEPHAAVRTALDEIRKGLPDGIALRPEDFSLLFDRASENLGRVSLGGNGGGVRLLTVMEARGLRFDRLFVLGMNRDIFPRPVREDSLMDDSVRLSLRPLLPDLPIKERGHDEERYLAAQLRSAADRVTFSWSMFDAEGRPLPRSPLIETLRISEGAAGSTALDREAAARAVELAGRDGYVEALGEAFEAAAGERGTTADGAALALRVVGGSAARGELDWGFVPPPAPASGLYVTAMEGLLRCPWRFYVERILRARPREQSPGALPGLDPRLVGNCVHRALEAIGVRSGVAADAELESLSAEDARKVAWPVDAELDALLLEVATACSGEAGVLLPGFARALAERTRRHLARIREIDTAEGDAPWLAVETYGDVALEDAPGGRVRFRADRIQRDGERFTLTDIKTGRPPKPPALQAAAYALAPEGPATGRYLMSRPEASPDRAITSLDGADSATRALLEDAASAALAVWRQGSFFPRLTTPEGREPDACRLCDVAAACNRSGDRERRALLERIERVTSDDASQDWFRAWELGSQ